MVEGNGVRITTREVYDQVVELKALTLELKLSLREVMKEHEEYENRIRALELKFYGILAGLAGGAVVLLRLGRIL